VSAASAIRRVEGRAIALPGSNIDTDRIIPARFLKAVSFEGLEAHVFADDRAEAAREGREHPFDRAGSESARVLVVNANFGCGSSREHAPQALKRRGIGAIVGESFADIFYANALSIGLVCVAASPADVQTLMAAVTASPGAAVVVDLAADRVVWDGGAVAIALPAAARQALLTGEWDAAARLVANEDAVRRVMARLPYLAAWPARPPARA
jgi:3-isopropylmalate/(R)-2-methylmalate dehydratase small subunit